MIYVNRAVGDYGYKCAVYLSAELSEYPGTLINERYCTAPRFSGFGVNAELHIKSHEAGNYVFGFSDPVWHVTDALGNTIITIPGLECGFSILVSPASDELAEIEFPTDNEGRYYWRGLPESNLPQTDLSFSYDLTALSGWVNGTPYSGATLTGPALTVGHTREPVYDMTETDPEGAFSGTAKFHGGPDFSDQYSYSAAAVGTDTAGNVYSCSFTAAAGGNFVSVSGANIPLGFLSGARVSTSITSWPLAYEYDIKERNGRNLGNITFTDRNARTWTGGSSPRFEWKGVQTVEAAGAFSIPGHTESASPNFNINNGWIFDDPAPSRFGGVSAAGVDDLNDYTVTLTDPETEEETVYSPSRVLLYAPLGDSGTLSGNLSVTFSPVTLSDFTESGWAVGTGGFSGHTLVINGADGRIYKTDFTRAPYNGETGALTAAELIPHLPPGNLIKIQGANFDPAGDYVLKVTAPGASYEFAAQNVTASEMVFDLTRPAGFRGADENYKYMTAAFPENYTGDASGQDPDAPYYIDETALSFPLYGPALFQGIEISGFAEGSYTLTRIISAYSEGTVYYNGAGEFCQVERVGRQHIAGVDAPIYRNRQNVFACSGRWIETPNNQKDVSPSGIERWTFPAVRELEGASGSRLIFPRDDFSAVTIAAGTRAAGGSPAAIADAVSEAAYIGWIQTDQGAGAPKIRPAVDYIEAGYLYTTDFNKIPGVIDICGAWQGVTGNGGTVEIDGFTGSGDYQYFVKGPGSGHLEYSRGGAAIREKDVETIPGGVMRYALRLLEIHGKILRNAAGYILRNSAGKILRGDFEE